MQMTQPQHCYGWETQTTKCSLILTETKKATPSDFIHGDGCKLYLKLQDVSQAINSDIATHLLHANKRTWTLSRKKFKEKLSLVVGGAVVGSLGCKTSLHRSLLQHSIESSLVWMWFGVLHCIVVCSSGGRQPYVTYSRPSSSLCSTFL